jgi:MFS family permease
MLTCSDSFELFQLPNLSNLTKAGFTMSRYSRHLQYSIALALYGLNTCLLPQLPSLNWFWAAWAIYGGTSAFIDIAINVWVLELFELHNMNLHVQLIHLSFSFGKLFLSHSSPLPLQSD